MDEPPATRRSLIVKLRDPADSDAWCEFVALYEPLVYRLARRKGLQDADARDLCQEVFRTVSQAIDRWDLDPARGRVFLVTNPGVRNAVNGAAVAYKVLVPPMQPLLADAETEVLHGGAELSPRERDQARRAAENLARRGKDLRS